MGAYMHIIGVDEIGCSNYGYFPIFEVIISEYVELDFGDRSPYFLEVKMEHTDELIRKT